MDEMNPRVVKFWIIITQTYRLRRLRQVGRRARGWEDRWEPITVTSIVGRIVWIKYEDRRRENTYAQRIVPSNPENDEKMVKINALTTQIDALSEQRKEMEKTLEPYKGEKDEA